MAKNFQVNPNAHAVPAEGMDGSSLLCKKMENLKGFEVTVGKNKANSVFRV